MGSDAAQEWTGILQLDLYHPKNTGHAAILADADKALDFFAPGKRLEYQGQRVLIRRSERSQIRAEEVWQSSQQYLRNRLDLPGLIHHPNHLQPAMCGLLHFWR
ncbi:hypothetical protein ULG90_24875 [Halopseudomonas pachastrellae]|nr:hypothetical protein ULG90_24875 [Halopseudomonas pachastrellae]